MSKPIVGSRLGSRVWRGAGIALAGAGLIGGSVSYFASQGAADTGAVAQTPIKHVVVLFDENESFDHYFGTYPHAANTDGVPFTGSTPTTSDGTPVHTLENDDALTSNPNSTAPYRFSYQQAWTCSQNHNYTPEQKAMDADADGKAAMDKFPESVSTDTCSNSTAQTTQKAAETMGYFDGNTVTALWNLAQNYAMSDNAWANNFGPSTVGALNVVSGQTYGATDYDVTSPVEDPTPLAGATNNTTVSAIGQSGEAGVGTVIGDPEPVYDDCADSDHTRVTTTVGMSGKNIGDLLNAKNVSWGYFAGGFTPSTPWDGSAPTNSGTANATGYAKCDTMSLNVRHSATDVDYNPHHNPFAFYKSTSNPHHFPGTPGVPIGANDPTNDSTKLGANHQYDLSVFNQAVKDGQLPAVSYVKPIYAQDGHPGNSDPLDEQQFLVNTVNEIENSPQWSSTAIVIAYDDSDGWYDHVPPTIINGSDVTNGAGGNPDDTALCSNATTMAAHPPADGQADRCGPSQRLPFLVISPFAKKNYVSHTLISQASIVRFIEDNWQLGSIGDGSFDARAGSFGDLLDMFDFSAPRTDRINLSANGEVLPPDTVTKVVTVDQTAPGHISAIGVVGLPKVVKVHRRLKARFLFASTGAVAGRVRLYDGRKVIATGTATNNTATLRFRLATRGKHRLHLSYLGSSTVPAYRGSTFVVRAK